MQNQLQLNPESDFLPEVVKAKIKILYVMRHAMYLRNFDSVIRMLAKRGHSISLAFTYTREGYIHDGQAIELSNNFKTISFTYASGRTDHWKSLTRAVRYLIDYLRYLHPRYKNTEKLTARAAKRIPRFLRLVLQLPLVRSPLVLHLMDRILRKIERQIPCDPQILNFIKSQNPDLVLVTPLVDIGSAELDYLKACRHLGLPVGLTVASWDNLTNKGLVQIEPDFMTVWNDAMKNEATELHGVPASKIEVTGSTIFDNWFEMSPSETRDQFCERVGLQKDKPYLLYLCSSSFIAEAEFKFVKKWLGWLRAQPGLGDLGVLIRPHPANFEQWKSADLSEFGNIAIYPRGGAHPISDRTKAEYFDSMYYSIGVMGINTSALIESGILNKACLTILADEFKTTQGGTLHFKYLVDGGLLKVAKNFEEHLVHINELVNHSDSSAEKRGNFINWFIRPRGIDQPCTNYFVASIEARYESTNSKVLAQGKASFLIWPLAKILNLVWPEKGSDGD